MDADETEQGIAELDVIARYGMLKKFFELWWRIVVCDRKSRDLTINKEIVADLEEIIRRDETTNNPHHGMSKVKYSSDEVS